MMSWENLSINKGDSQGGRLGSGTLRLPFMGPQALPEAQLLLRRAGPRLEVVSREPEPRRPRFLGPRKVRERRTWICK